MSQALYRTIVGPVSPVYIDEDTPTPYRQAKLPQTKMNGPVVEPNEATQPIVNTPTNPIS